MATERDFDKVVNHYISPKVPDLVYNATPMLEWFRSKAKLRKYPERIDEPLEVTKGQGGWYSDMQELDRTRIEILEKAYFYIKQAYAQITVSHKERLTTASPEAVVALLMTKAHNAFKKIRDDLSIGVASGSAADSIVGLTTQIATSATDLGGISETGHAWWVPQRIAKGTAVITYPDITLMIAKCSDGEYDEPDILMTDKFIKQYIWANILQAQERYESVDKIKTAAGLGLVAGKRILVDAQFESSGDTGGIMYFINSEHLYLRVHSQDNLKTWPYQKADRQFAYSKQWTWTGALCCNDRGKQGVISGIDVPALN